MEVSLPDIKGTATVSRVIEDDKVYTHVSPEHLSFGCVACGFVYSLTVRITNKGPKPQAFKIRILPHADASRDCSRVRVKFVPMKIAPGVKQEFQLELLAYSPGAQSFDLLITQGVNKLPLAFVVKALIVPLEVFKHVAKSLSLQKVGSRVRVRAMLCYVLCVCVLPLLAPAVRSPKSRLIPSSSSFHFPTNPPHDPHYPQ